jgi:hypothetical protein
MTAAVIGWLYGWFLLRGVRNEYAAGDLGPAPPALLVFLLLVTFVTIATAVVAGMRMRAWPLTSIAAGVLLVVGILLAQYVPLHSYAERHRAGAAITLSEVVTVALRNRTPAGIVIATATPMLLLSGLSGLMLRRLPPRPPARLEPPAEPSPDSAGVQGEQAPNPPTTHRSELLGPAWPQQRLCRPSATGVPVSPGASRPARGR